MTKPTEQEFLKDVATHRMEVVRDDGLHRHVQFRRPDTSCMGFDLVTWPGYLCYSGDMGTFVFARLPDMFEFFRQPITEGGTPRINPQYWAEKVQAGDSCDGVMQYSPQMFRGAIQSYLDVREADDALREAVAREVLPHADDGMHDALRAAIDFIHNGRMPFQDFWESNVYDYTYRFIWCCYALVWGIKEYDAKKGKSTVTAAPESARNNIMLYCAGVEVLRLTPDKAYYRGREITDDADLVKGLREWLLATTLPR